MKFSAHEVKEDCWKVLDRREKHLFITEEGPSHYRLRDFSSPILGTNTSLEQTLSGVRGKFSWDQNAVSTLYQGWGQKEDIFTLKLMKQDIVV